MPDPEARPCVVCGVALERARRADAATCSDRCRQRRRRHGGRRATFPTRAVRDLAILHREGLRFSTLYVDPPWRYGNQATRGATDHHYPTMTVAEIAALPVGALAAANAHLHLWTTNGFLFEALAVLEAWGFAYAGSLVWTKPQMGLGNYWRVSHEFLLLGVRGAAPFRDRRVKSWITAPRGRHSAKPEQVRALIERVSPGPYLECFARPGLALPAGWTVWGNEVPPTP